MAVQRNDWISPEEYLRIDRESLDVKYEYDAGRMYAMSGGSTSHSLLAGNMFTILKSHLRGGPCKAYTSDMRVYVSEEQYFYPDVSVSCDPKRNTRDKRQPSISSSDCRSAFTDYGDARSDQKVRAVPAMPNHSGVCPYQSKTSRSGNIHARWKEVDVPIV